jgi:hypothetical protein
MQVGEVEEYLENGPGFVFVYHPALGPLWEVIGQKLHGGTLARGAEVALEVSEAQVCGWLGVMQGSHGFGLATDSCKAAISRPALGLCWVAVPLISWLRCLLRSGCIQDRQDQVML